MRTVRYAHVSVKTQNFEVGVPTRLQLQAAAAASICVAVK
jgi:hypothetical protein